MTDFLWEVKECGKQKELFQKQRKELQPTKKVVFKK